MRNRFIEQHFIMGIGKMYYRDFLEKELPGWIFLFFSFILWLENLYHAIQHLLVLNVIQRWWSIFRSMNCFTVKERVIEFYYKNYDSGVTTFRASRARNLRPLNLFLWGYAEDLMQLKTNIRVVMTEIFTEMSRTYL